MSRRFNNIIISEFFCKPVCPEEKPFEYVFTQECFKYCPIEDIKQKICILNFINYNTKSPDIMLQNIEKEFTREGYNASELDTGKDDVVIEDGKMTITLATTKNQKNNINRFRRMRKFIKRRI